MPDDRKMSDDVLRECEDSARFWATHIGGYSDKMRQRADTFAIIAALISTATGLAVWTTLSNSTQWWAQLVVSIMALIAAGVAITPKFRGYAECAAASAPLGTKYGHVLGELIDARRMLKNGDKGADTFAVKAHEEFEQVRADKEKLRPYPRRLQNASKRPGAS